MTKTLGEIACDAGADAGLWMRRWQDVPPEDKPQWEAMAQAMVAAEREACAQVAEQCRKVKGLRGVCEAIAEGIRMRSNAELRGGAPLLRGVPLE